MSFADDNPGYRIDSPAAALEYLRVELAKLNTARAKAFLSLTVTDQKAAYHRLVLLQAGAFGALSALHRTGFLADEAYARLRAEIQQATSPAVVDHARG